MDELIKYMTKKGPLTVLVIIGLLVPGVFTIFVFREDLLLQLDIFKLILLSFTICIPTYLVSLLSSGLVIYKSDKDSMDKLQFISLLLNFCIFAISYIDLKNMVLSQYIEKLIITSAIYFVGGLLHYFINQHRYKKKKTHVKSNG